MPESTSHTNEDVSPRPFWRRGVDRRTILVAGGAALLLANLPGDTPLPAVLAADATPDLTLDLLRREDMLKLHFEFFNLRRSTAAGPPKLVPINTTAQSMVVVGFDSQHLMEETTSVSDPGGNPPANLPAPGDLATRAAGPSRIAFLVPSTVKELPFTEEGLLAWSSWVMQVVPKSATPAVPDQLDATTLVTDLLLVDWLHLTPEQYASWAHVTHPVTSAGRTELWHTRLAPRDDFGRPDPLLGPADIRATATRKPVTADDKKFNDMFYYPADDRSLDDIVTQSNTIAPVRGDLVLLSALGSSLELEGKWAEPAQLAEWRHRSAIGRDNYVRIEKRGFLFPYGHQAVLVTETERAIAGGAARLLRRAFIRVLEPVKPFDDNGLPFRTVEITTTTTPNLAAAPEPIPGTGAFWVQYSPGTGTADVPFPIVATDWTGNRVESVAHLAFVGKEDAGDTTVLTALRKQFHPDDFTTIHPRRTHELGGQKVAFAPVTGTFDTKKGLVAAADDGAPRNTAFPAARLHLNVELRVKDGEAGFIPRMLAAEIRMPAVEALAGGQALATAIGYDPEYVASSFGTIKGEMFARVGPTVQDVGSVVQAILAHTQPDQLPGNPVTAEFGRNVAQLGGVAAPDLDIRGLSRSLGPLSGPAATISQIAKDGVFNPGDFFPDTAKLLGGLSLAEILGFDPDLPDALTLPVENGPKIVTTPEYGNGKDHPPTAVTTVFDWQPKLPDKLTAAVFHPKLPDRPHASLTLHGENRTVFGTGGVTTTSTIKGDLRDFAIELVKGTEEGAAPDPLSFIKLTFRRFAFEQHDGAKPVIHVELDKIEFEGPLNFVNTLQKFLVSSGKGLGIDVQPSGITAGYTLAIPDVGIGVFALQHLAFSAGLSIPFDGSAARARFAFCSREHPFTLSVSLFGGGGFFALALGTDGFELMEASIEFGGAVAFNLGVASGSVSVMAGIYFKLEHKPKAIGGDGKEIDDHDVITLTGYVRANGSLNVLGLITISAEFYLGLSYTNDGGKNIVEGEASLTIEIEILFFSKSVTLTVHKSFAGPGSPALAARGAAALPAGGSPSFGDQISQDDWNTYCDAFAA